MQLATPQEFPLDLLAALNTDSGSDVGGNRKRDHLRHGAPGGPFSGCRMGESPAAANRFFNGISIVRTDPTLPHSSQAESRIAEPSKVSNGDQDLTMTNETRKCDLDDRLLARRIPPWALDVGRWALKLPTQSSEEALRGDNSPRQKLLA